MVAFELAGRPAKGIQMKGGLSFTHTSNGGIKKPNRGLNVPTASLGINFFPSQFEVAQADDLRSIRKPSYRWSFLLGFHYGKYELEKEGGDPANCKGIRANAHYYLTKGNRLVGGLDLEYHNKDEKVRDVIGNPDAQLYRIGLFCGDEIIMKNVGISLGVGIYLNETVVDDDLFYRSSIRYYLMKAKQNSLNPYFGLGIKTHKFTAEYASLEFGINYK